MTHPISNRSCSTFREVLVLRALPGLGDFLCVTPALRALRAALPDARITLLGLPSTKDLVARYRHLVDDFLEFPGFPGLPEQPVNRTALLDLLRIGQGRFDLALQMHGSGTVSNVFVQLLGARMSAGFYAPPMDCPDPATFALDPAELPEPRRWLALLESLGMPAQGEQLEFPVARADEAALDVVLREVGVPSDARLALVHGGASELCRRLDPRVLAEVADGLSARGRTVVLTGAGDEADRAQAVRAHASCPVFDLSGRTDVGVLAALIGRAGIVVTSDTGTSHLASALRTPSVVVFLASDIGRWAPLDRRRHRVVDGSEAAITAARILVEADSLLTDVSSSAPACADLRTAKRVLVVPPVHASEAFQRTLRRVRASLPNAAVVLLASGSFDRWLGAHTSLVDEVLPADALSTLDPDALAALIDRVAGARLDAALVFTAAGESAFEAAYLAYLAGVPLRAGLGLEFGGTVLAPCIQPDLLLL
jgi:ADP-heptose:LPS heptosyltransferase